MKRGDPGLDPELEAFLTPRAIERRVPADLRLRALARGRAIVAAGGAIPRPRPVELSLPTAVPAARRGSLLRVAFAASIAFAAGSVVAVAALRSRTTEAPTAASKTRPAMPPVARDVKVREPAREPAKPAAATPDVTAKPARRGRAQAHADAVTAELDLLQRAHAAYTRRDFSDALILAAEHARRFPHGHLAEQREALRVRSLAGAGRTEDAHRAAAAFKVRFPRSVLLPRLEL